MPDKQNDDPRGDLDTWLQVADWGRTDEPTQAGAPGWWRGDEDASQSFLREMHVDLTRIGER
jgi:hypothetical protein